MGLCSLRCDLAEWGCEGRRQIPHRGKDSCLLEDKQHRVFTIHQSPLRSRCACLPISWCRQQTTAVRPLRHQQAFTRSLTSDFCQAEVQTPNP